MMEKTIGFSLIVAGALVIVGVVMLSKEQIAWPIFRAIIYLAVPILVMWFFLHKGFRLAEKILLERPAPIIFLGVLSVLVFLFSEVDLIPYSIFLVGFMMIYLGLFFVLVIANLNIGF